MGASNNIKRMNVKLTTVGIWKPMRERLTQYARAQMPRPVIADLVSIAVKEYLDRQEGQE